MFGAFIKSLIICLTVVFVPVVVMVLIAMGVTSIKMIAMLLALIMPFLIVGLVNGYIAGLEA